jgi:GAF domain-containing protein/HAMP domain-containing protein
LVLSGQRYNVPDKDGSYTGLHGDQSLVASSPVVLGQQRFSLVSELPEAEALEGAFRTLYLLLGGLALVVVLTGAIGYWASQQFSRPISRLVEAARALGGGDLSQRAEKTGLIETDTLGQSLNTMAAQVQDLVGSLEARVAARTRDLFLTLEVGQSITRSTQQKDTLQRTVDFIQDRFDLYYVQVYLVDDAQRFAVLTAGTGDVGQQLLERKHRLDLRETSIVARTFQTRRPVLVANTQTSEIHRINPLLPDTRSEVAIPLIVGDAVVGVLDLQAREADTFREDNLPVFQAMSSQLSSGLRAAQFFSEMQEAVDRAAAINRRLTGEAWEGYLGRAALGGRVGYQYDLQAIQPVKSDGGGNGHPARMERPILLREQPIGQIVLGENTARTWSEDEIELVDEVARRVAQTLEQYRAFDETAAALAQSEVLYRASQRIAAADNPQDLVSALVETVQIPVFNRALLFGFEHDADNQVIAWNVLANWHDGRGVAPTAVGTRLASQAGASAGWLANTASAMFMNDVQDERETRVDVPSRERFVQRNIHAMGVLPLWVGARQLGMLVLEGEEIHEFTPEETRALETLAGQVAVALDGLQLLQQTQQRASEMQTVAEVGTEAASSLDLYRLLREVSELTKERFGLYHAHVFLLNDTGDSLVLAAGAGRAGEMLVASGHKIDPNNERSLVARAARTRQVVISNDVTTTPDFLPNPLLPQTRSEMALPLVAGDVVLGVLDVQSDQPGRFTEADANIYMTLASQVAAAAQNARLYQTIAQRSQRLETQQAHVLELLRDQAFVEGQLHEVLTDITRISAQTLGVERVSAWFYTENRAAIECRALYLLTEDRHEDGVVLSATDYPGYFKALENHRVIVADDAHTHPDTHEFSAGYLTPLNIQSMMDVPIWVGDQVIGVLCHEYVGQPYHWTLEDQSFAQNMAVLVSLGVETASRREAEGSLQRRAVEMQTVAELGAEATAALDLRTLLDRVVNLTKERFGLYHAHIYLLDDAGAQLNLAAGAGAAGQTMVAAAHHIPADQARSLVARAARSREAVIVNDVTAVGDFLPNPLLPKTRAEMALPLVIGDQVIGVLDVQSDMAGRFTEEDVTVYGTLAAQVSAAVQNVRLLETTQRRAVEMQTVSEVGATAATSLDLERLLHGVSELTKERFGLYHAHVYLLDPEGDNLLLAAGAGRPGERMMAAGHRIAAANERSLVARAARSRQVVMVNDVTQVPDFLPNPLLPRTRSEMAVPLIAGEAVIGVLDVQSDEPDHFTPEDIEVQMTLASQVAVAVQNARLYTEQVRAADRLREVDRLKSEFLASMSHELRTPLNSIIGYAEVLLDGIDGDLTDEMTEDISAIHGSGKHLLNLINDILDLAKIEAGQMDLVVEEVELIGLAEDLFSISRVLVKNKPVELVLDIPEDLPHLHVDVLRLRQIISNLLTNAIKFTEKGSITLYAHMHEPDPNMIEIGVRDTGVGMKPEHLALIFDRFRQVDQSHTRRAGGTGLGLSIMRQLVEMHGGQVWVDSQLGVGSVFAFTVPMANG